MSWLRDNLKGMSTIGGGVAGGAVGGPLGAVIGSQAGGLIGSLFGDDSDADAARALAEQAYKQYEGIDTQDLSDQINYQQIQDLMAQYNPNLDKSLAELSQRKEGRNALLDALKGYKGISEQGLSAIDRANIAANRQSADLQNKASQEAIVQDMQQRGTLGGGAELASRLGAQQNTSNSMYNQGMQTASQAQQARMNALAGLGSIGGTLQSQDTAFDQSNRDARMMIDKYSNMNRFNQLQAQQNTAANNTGIANKQVSDRINEKNNYFGRRLSLAEGKSNALLGQSGVRQKQSDQRNQDWANMANMGMQGVGSYMNYQQRNADQSAKHPNYQAPNPFSWKMS